MTAKTARTDRFSRRRVLALGAGAGIVIAGRATLSSAHDGAHGESTPMPSTEASPEASPMATDTGTAAAYMTIRNTGSANETLLGARTDVASRVELHAMAVDASGVMSMSPVPDGLEIPAGQELVIEPQGYHLMLVDLAQDLLPNTTYEMVLSFAQAGDVSVTVAVQMMAPTDTQTVSGSGQDLSILAAWSRPAPRIDGVTTSSRATPEHRHG